MGQHRESTLQFVATAALANAWSDLTQSQGHPDRHTNNKETNPAHDGQKEPLQRTRLKAKAAQPQELHTTLKGDTPEIKGLGEEGTLHCRVLQDLLFTKPLLSIGEDVGDFPKTQKRELEKMRRDRRICRK